MYLLVTAALFFLPVFIQNGARAAPTPTAVAHSEDCPQNQAALCNTDLRKRHEREHQSERARPEYIHVTPPEAHQHERFADAEGREGHHEKRGEETAKEGSNVSLRPSKRWGGYEGSRCCGSSGGWGRHGCCGNRW
jgi:hypothetical protein